MIALQKRIALLYLAITISLFAKPTKRVKIGFFINYMTVRGTEVATYDYADFNEIILGNKSFIFNNIGDSRYNNGQKDADYSLSTKEKFLQRFGNHYIECATMEEVDRVIAQEKIDILYVLKGGLRSDNKFSHVCKNAIHMVFPDFDPHGDIYATISEWLSGLRPELNLPYVPHIVRLSDTKETLRNALGIPYETVVFGSLGGADSFNIKFAQEAVIEIAQKKRNWFFIFMNIRRFCNLPNVLFVPGTADMIHKTKFINSCDAMIHARYLGESFGLSCAEFSIKNKPVITWDGSPERSHFKLLGDKAFYYHNKRDLKRIIRRIGKKIKIIRSKDWDACSVRFSPKVVMQKFDEVFIQPLIR